MIGKAIQQKFLKELEKHGNIYVACSKVGIDRSTIYRRMHKNKEFREVIENIVAIGREGSVDIAEYALLQKARDKDLGAIKYLLGHNSSRYGAGKEKKIVIEHSRGQGYEKPQLPFMEDILEQEDWVYAEEQKRLEVEVIEEPKKDETIQSNPIIPDEPKAITPPEPAPPVLENPKRPLTMEERKERRRQRELNDPNFRWPR